jgi:gentisate 1,2-dioxygenase
MMSRAADVPAPRWGVHRHGARGGLVLVWNDRHDTGICPFRSR